MGREVKVFRTSVDPNPEPYPFALEFENTVTKQVTRHEFSAHGNPGAGADLTVTSIVQVVDGKQVTDLNGIMRFFQRVLVGDGYDRLKALIDNPTVVIETDTLASVMNYLMGEYSGRPTVQPSPSSGGLPSTGGISTPTA